MVAAAIGGAAVVGAVASSSAAGKAADAQSAAAREASQTQLQMYNQTREDLAPYRDLGAAMTNPLMRLATGGPDNTGGGFSPENIQAMLESLPGYQFTRDQGLKSVQNSAAARGLSTSGAALKGAATYATGLADTTYGNEFNRLLQLVNLGENASAQTGAYGTATGQSIGANLIGAGNAQAASYLAGGQAIGNAANGLANGYIFSQMYGPNAMPSVYGAPTSGAGVYNLNAGLPVNYML